MRIRIPWISRKAPKPNVRELEDAWLVGEALLESFTNEELLACYRGLGLDLEFKMKVSFELENRRAGAKRQAVEA